MSNALLAFLVVTASFLAIPAEGHHGLAAFDTAAPVTFKGTVTDFHFVNPHCVVEFDVKDDKGQVRNWKAELGSANNLGPKGWSESSIEAGDEVTITGYRAKNGAPSIWVTKIAVANGRELKVDSAN